MSGHPASVELSQETRCRLPDFGVALCRRESGPDRVVTPRSIFRMATCLRV